jgi:DNA ligase (NAD+)
MKDETVWLNLEQMTELFKRDKSVISRHLKNIFEENELDKQSVVANYATTASDGKIYQVDYYNLDVIISVGYRVKSKEGIKFRKWATNILKEYMLKEYAVNKRRLEYLEKTVKNSIKCNFLHLKCKNCTLNVDFIHKI